ncbi:MAG: acylphosphatase [Candidatus Nealsonbacteria bacterium]|nr:acylphosphatase [Candidatus Nealsonbacteria bacterium]
MKEKARVHLFISGKVQGVFFRLNAKKKAEELGVSGWAGNLSDGRVEILIEGEKENIEKLVKWAQKGPLFAKVDELEIEQQEFKGEFHSFEIKR